MAEFVHQDEEWLPTSSQCGRLPRSSGRGVSRGAAFLFTFW